MSPRSDTHPTTSTPHLVASHWRRGLKYNAGRKLTGWESLPECACTACDPQSGSICRIISPHCERRRGFLVRTEECDASGAAADTQSYLAPTWCTEKGPVKHSYPGRNQTVQRWPSGR